MTTLTIEIPVEVYDRLRAAAVHQGHPIEAVAQTWLTEHSVHVRSDLPSSAPGDERERITEVLRAAGILTALSPDEQARAAQSDLTLQEARAILDRADGRPLSELILEMRGPKA